MADRNPYPRPGAGDAAGGRPDAAAGPADELRERLAALDALYEAGRISAAELGDARREVLASFQAAPELGSGAPGGSTGVAARRDDPAPQAIVPSAPPQARRRTIAGLPIWAGAVVAALVAGLIALGVVLVLGTGSDGGTASDGEPDGYAEAIAGPLDRLTASAIATGKALARVSEPSELAGLNRTAERQLDLVEQARRRLSELAVDSADRRAHRQLLRAAANQRRYLVQLGRATSGQPSQRALAAANRARRAGAVTVRSYASFFALAPGVPDAITDTELTDVAGLRAALRKGLAAASGRGAPGFELTPVFIDPDPGDPADVCFGPGRRPTATASLTLGGARHYSGIVQCGNEDAGAYAANGVLRFDLSSAPRGASVVGVGGTFGIDEVSTSQRGAVAQFTVRYRGQVLCRVRVAWGAPRSCPTLGAPARIRGGTLSIEQSVTPVRPDRGLWAGVVNPVLITG